MRQAGLYAYTDQPDGRATGPRLELRKDTNPASVPRRWHAWPRGSIRRRLVYAEAALTDFHLDVRLAAVRALGELGGDKARTDLQRLLIHEPETVRAGAILALAAGGDDVTVFASANDASWQVRRSVAQALSVFPDAARRNDCPTVAGRSQRRSAPRRDRFARRAGRWGRRARSC